MKIAFLCSGLEPGRNGVGDYTRMLAREIQRRGHKCLLISLNDRDICLPQEAAQGGVPVLRLPESLERQERIHLARARLEEHQPDWVSLQFVCYGFQRKGLISGWAEALRKLCAGYRVHLMFHELWIGEPAGSSLLHRLTGMLQKFFILDLVKKMRPLAVDTHTPAYQTMLARRGVQSDRLPLFGNIPAAAPPATEWLLEQVQVAKGEPVRREDYWFFGFFGMLRDEWKPEPLFGYINQAAQRVGRQVAVFSAGRMGEAGERLWKRIAATSGRDFLFVNFGEQPAEIISRYLQSLDFGITYSPRALIGKSGTAAAMLDHGLPVIISRDDIQFRFKDVEEERESHLFLPVTPQLPEALLKTRKGSVNLQLPRTANQFLRRLEEVF